MDMEGDNEKFCQPVMVECDGLKRRGCKWSGVWTGVWILAR